jgi:hypothetical protein
MRVRFRVVAVSAIVLAGCSGATEAKSSKDAGKTDAKAAEAAPEMAVGSVMGTIDGAPFDLRFERAQNSGDTAMGVYPTIKVALFDVVASPEACIDARVGRALDIYVTNAADTTAVGPGTYGTPDPDAGDLFGTNFAHFYLHDYAGGGLDRDIFGPGSATLTEVSSSTVSGSFDVTLQSNGTEVGHLTGTFAAPVCQ